MTPENAKKSQRDHQTHRVGVFKNSISCYVRERENVGKAQCTVAGWHLARLASHSRCRFPADVVGDEPCEEKKDMIWRGSEREYQR